MEITVNVKDIKQGDKLIHNGVGWIAMDDAERHTFNGQDDIMVDVQFISDGCFGHRAWPIVQEQTLKVVRDAVDA